MRTYGSLDYDLASKIMKPNMTNVVDAHNFVYNDHRRMSGSANMLEISPRLQEHKITTRVVAMSKVELGRASQVRCMIIGINIIFDSECDAAGPKQTRKQKQKP